MYPCNNFRPTVTEDERAHAQRATPLDQVAEFRPHIMRRLHRGSDVSEQGRRRAEFLTLSRVDAWSAALIRVICPLAPSVVCRVATGRSNAPPAATQL